MKSLKYFFSISTIFILFNCNKMKEKINIKIPDYSYKNAGIDHFYYSYESIGNTSLIPLIKPYFMDTYVGHTDWSLNIKKEQNELGTAIRPIAYFNVINRYIYGYKTFVKDIEDAEFDSPEKWFIIDTQNNKLTYFEKEIDFKKELKKLNLPEEWLTPNEVFEQYKNDPILPWFPEDIKKQLEEVKAKKKSN